MRSLRLRFAVLAAVLVAGVVAVLGSAIYVALDRQLGAQVDSRLAGRSADLREVRPFGPQGGGAQLVLGPGRRADGLFYFGADANGHVVFRTENASGLNLELPRDALQQALDGGDALVTVDSGGQQYRLDVTRASLPMQASVAASSPDEPAVMAGLVVAAGQSLQSISDTLNPLRLLLVVAVLLGLVLGGFGGLLVGARALLPLTDLSSAVDQVGTDGDLSRRLGRPRGHDEVARLAGAFNASLDRLEAAYRELEQLLVRQRRFVADASHELRTPLTVMRADVALLEKYPGMPSGDRASLVARCLGEVERMTRLSNDLLEQARSEAGVTPVRRDALDWDDVIGAGVADLASLVAPRVLTTELAAIGAGTGDADAVHRIMRIIGDNISHHTGPATRVHLRAEARGGAVEVAVGDDGPGVDPSFLPAMFDRFARADGSRTVPGSGLGLAIARSIAEAHGGAIRAEAGNPGLRLIVTLPRGAP